MARSTRKKKYYYPARTVGKIFCHGIISRFTATNLNVEKHRESAHLSLTGNVKKSIEIKNRQKRTRFAVSVKGQSKDRIIFTVINV